MKRSLALIAPLLATCTGSSQPTARAFRIGSLTDTIGGPHAIGRIVPPLAFNPSNGRDQNVALI